MLLDIFNIVLQLSLAGTVTASIILLVKAVAGKRLTARWHYVVWFILIIKLVVPVTVPSSISVFNLLKPMNNFYLNEHGNTMINNNLDIVIRLPDDQPVAGEPVKEVPLNKPGNDYSKVQKTVDWMPFGAYIWLAGVILMFTAIVVSYRRLFRQILRNTVLSEHLITDLAQRCFAESGVKRKVAVRCVSEFKLPFVFGLFRPEIVMPALVAENMDEKGLKAVLTHEMMHIKYQDHMIRLMILIVQSIHWFNPLLWFSFNRMMKDCEAACDAAVIKEYSENMRKEYASILLDIAQKQNNKAGFNPVIAFGESNLKRRVTDVMKFRKYSIAAITASIVVLIILSATVLTGATNNGVIEPPGMSGGKNTSAAVSIDVKNKEDQLLQEIIDNGPAASSNPYDYIKGSKAFDELVAMGNPALEYMLDIFAKSNEDGLKEYVMACACAKIMGNFDKQNGIGVASGRAWFYKYGVFEKDTDLHKVDADRTGT